MFYHPMENKKIIVGGIYQHYKRLSLYQIVALALHSETKEEMVVYQSIDKETEYWVRPLALFCENVIVDGISQPRFRYIKMNISL